MKKNIAIIILAIMSVLSLCLITACGNNENNADSSSQQSITSSVDNSTAISSSENTTNSTNDSTTSSASVSTSDSASQSSEVAEFTITFCQQGKADIIKTVKSGESLTDIPSLAEIDGYEVSWDITDFNNVTSNIVVNIVKTPINYTITYNLAGGTNSNVNLNQYNIETETITLTNATREGYTFDGWYVNETKVTEIVKGSTGNKTLTTKWTAIEYSVIFNMANGEGGYDGHYETEENPTKYTIEDSMAFIEPICDITGYGFKGWYTEKNDGEKVTSFVAGTTIGPKTYYARWERLEYTIAYYNVENSTNSNLNSYNVDTETFSLNNPLKLGYEFKGWYTDSELTNSSNTTVTKGSIGDLKFYAKWQVELYEITYIMNGGTNNENNLSFFTILTLGDVDNTIPLYEATKTNNSEILSLTYKGNGLYEKKIGITEYTFLGWYAESTFENRVNELSLSLGSVTLFAKWSSTTTPTATTFINAYKRVDKDGVANDTGSYLLFGEYPQTIKSSSVTVSSTVSANGYYLGSDNAYYAKVTANPNVSGYTFSTGDSVTRGSVYYFKVEPIRWRILSESGDAALILCDSIIANGTYYDNNFNRTIEEQTIYANNYEYSRVRAWLNDTFYETAFTDLQQELIMTTTVDNSVSSTGYDSNQYACSNTQDKIFLLSYKEVTNSSYGFSSSSSNKDLARKMVTSDYTRATGVYMSTESDCFGSGNWWLRSPYYKSNIEARYVNNSGELFNYCYIESSNRGVVPALKIKLS